MKLPFLKLPCLKLPCPWRDATTRVGWIWIACSLAVPVAWAAPPQLVPRDASADVAGAALSPAAELGKLLFFDGRLSGDATISCATCHQPEKTYADGLPLSKGYPGTLYFRNTPSLLNVKRRRFYWDGRMGGDDLPSLIRDHISEAHFLQADGRLVIERLRQVPGYVDRFERALGGEPTYGRILNALAAFVQTRRSADSPLDRHLRGDAGALAEPARRGLALFQGKAGCIRCHAGENLHDDLLHKLDVPANWDVFREPLRHITFRRFFRTLGVSDYRSLRTDIGHACVTKQTQDRGRFSTPSLREVAQTAPYMHNGSLKTLHDVVRFYNAGGGPGQTADLQPLGLTDGEIDDLVALLESLSSDYQRTAAPQLPPYELSPLGEKRESP